jgi:hypothetical protein
MRYLFRIAGIRENTWPRYFRISRNLISLSVGLSFALSAAAGIQDQFSAVDNLSTAERLHEDAKLIAIVGRAIGQAGNTSKLTVHINGIEFTTAADPVYGGQSGRSAYEICSEFREKIGKFAPDAHLIPEFDAFCLPIAGEAALLLVQASLSKHPPPTPNDEEIGRLIKAKSRYLYVKVYSSDDEQRLNVI